MSQCHDIALPTASHLILGLKFYSFRRIYSCEIDIEWLLYIENVSNW